MVTNEHINLPKKTETRCTTVTVKEIKPVVTTRETITTTNINGSLPAQTTVTKKTYTD